MDYSLDITPPSKISVLGLQSDALKEECLGSTRPSKDLGIHLSSLACVVFYGQMTTFLRLLISSTEDTF
ncbi:hypothetical protein P7K49_018481 [Saguinus oedipus]|uniref:Uncharacterized protein n=1 Tax=Saguinus oedipus TaxID=9490 RepID=A0ABQ9V6G3_SAGOE|nr:hypothetical protein P7K49_018481 [Saguinus oedipus]